VDAQIARACRRSRQAALLIFGDMSASNAPLEIVELLIIHSKVVASPDTLHGKLGAQGREMRRFVLAAMLGPMVGATGRADQAQSTFSIG
jgi:hypothetical protein